MAHCSPAEKLDCFLFFPEQTWPHAYLRCLKTATCRTRAAPLWVSFRKRLKSLIALWVNWQKTNTHFTYTFRPSMFRGLKKSWHLLSAEVPHGAGSGTEGGGVPAQEEGEDDISGTQFVCETVIRSMTLEEAPDHTPLRASRSGTGKGKPVDLCIPKNVSYFHC